MGVKWVFRYAQQSIFHYQSCLRGQHRRTTAMRFEQNVLTLTIIN